MKYYGTKNNKDYGFYLENFDGAIEITDEYWQELLMSQNDGKRIIHYENSVIAVNESEYSNDNGVWVKLVPSEVQAKQLKIQNAIRYQEIENELAVLDAKRIRAIAEPEMKDEEISWLEFYNNQIKELREELEQVKA